MGIGDWAASVAAVLSAILLYRNVKAESPYCYTESVEKSDGNSLKITIVIVNNGAKDIKINYAMWQHGNIFKKMNNELICYEKETPVHLVLKDKERKTISFYVEEGAPIPRHSQLIQDNRAPSFLFSLQLLENYPGWHAALIRLVQGFSCQGR